MVVCNLILTTTPSGFFYHLLLFVTFCIHRGRHILIYLFFLSFLSVCYLSCFESVMDQKLQAIELPCSGKLRLTGYPVFGHSLTGLFCFSLAAAEAELR